MTGEAPEDDRQAPDTELLEPPVVVDRSPVPPHAVLDDLDDDWSMELARPGDWPVPYTGTCSPTEPPGAVCTFPPLPGTL